MSTDLVEQPAHVNAAPSGVPADQEAKKPASAAVSPPEAGPEKHTDVPRHSRWWLYLILAAVVVAAVVYFGVMPRLKRDKATAAGAAAQKSAVPVVEVVSVTRGAKVQHITLPGTVTPATTIHVYGRAAGFLKARYVDLGDKVHRGQLLGLISSPDLDATVLQQRALLQQSKDLLHKARTQENLEQVTYDRVHTLTLHGVLSQQEDDVAQTALAAAAADVLSSQNAMSAVTGSLQRATALASFEEIRSPIDGTVTARNIEVGSLISSTGAGEGLASAAAAGPNTGGAQGGELFQIADLRDLRTFVAVPEQDALYMGTGPKATLSFTELPGETFGAAILRSNESLSQQTRTLVVEMKVEDPKHILRPGMYASVQLGFNAPDPGILISGDSVITLAQGAFVAVVEDNIVHMRLVHAGRDLGTQIYITSGLTDRDVIVVNPTDVVQEGVHVIARAAPKGQEK